MQAAVPVPLAAETGYGPRLRADRYERLDRCRHEVPAPEAGPLSGTHYSKRQRDG
jgi:hypothetical protein